MKTLRKLSYISSDSVHADIFIHDAGLGRTGGLRH